MRLNYLDGKKIPAVVHVNDAGDRDTIDNIADMLGISPKIEASFAEETKSDLFSEQALLCGTVPALVLKAFEFLKSKGIPEKIAMYECLHELTYILEVIKEKGMGKMYDSISPVAMVGGLNVWEEIDKDSTINNLFEKIYNDIENNEFLERLNEADRREKINFIKKRSAAFDKTLRGI